MEAKQQVHLQKEILSQVGQFASNSSFSGGPGRNYKF